MKLKLFSLVLAGALLVSAPSHAFWDFLKGSEEQATKEATAPATTAEAPAADKETLTQQAAEKTAEGLDEIQPAAGPATTETTTTTTTTTTPAAPATEATKQ